ncbi:MAG TPA: M23 family metallopeptidase [Brevundimonas sp.]|uniref:M23 family metallopeptidase n=1 Tax=Brevundimonas sp. TaxID=1871086 RepID=UPI002DF09D86|nr:M23 family metallopeptidase [Brevundimonas sp.]
MRRLMPTVRRFLIHTGQAAALATTAVLAMAAAPNADPDPVVVEASATPAEAPIVAVAEPAGPIMREIMFHEPVKGFAINSRYGTRHLAGEAAARAHKGVDFAAPTGTGVFVAAEGTVLRTGYQPTGFGRFVEVRHPNGMTSLYAHLSRVDVRSGQELYSGERVGLVGSTGYSTGPHLHFEMRRNGEHVDPSRIMGQTFDVVVEG